MTRIKTLFWFVGCCAMASCTRTLNEREFAAWISDYNNGLHCRKLSGEYFIDLQYKPSNYMALQQAGQSGNDFQTSVEQLDGLQYYTLTVGLADSEKDFLTEGSDNLADKQRLLYYYSYQFQDAITLEDSGTILPCVLYHFERSADIRNSRTFVLGFENPNKASTESRLVIQSSVINPLPVKIKISKSNIPTLKI